MIRQELHTLALRREWTMSIGIIASLFGAVIGIALLSVAVSTPNTSSIISSFGDAFKGAIGAAKH
jgi:hypothetical protein